MSFMVIRDLPVFWRHWVLINTSLFEILYWWDIFSQSIFFQILSCIWSPAAAQLLFWRVRTPPCPVNITSGTMECCQCAGDEEFYHTVAAVTSSSPQTDRRWRRAAELPADISCWDDWMKATSLWPSWTSAAQTMDGMDAEWKYPDGSMMTNITLIWLFTNLNTNHLPITPGLNSLYVESYFTDRWGFYDAQVDKRYQLTMPNNFLTLYQTAVGWHSIVIKPVKAEKYGKEMREVRQQGSTSAT